MMDCRQTIKELRELADRIESAEPDQLDFRVGVDCFHITTKHQLQQLGRLMPGRIMRDAHESTCWVKSGDWSKVEITGYYKPGLLTKKLKRIEVEIEDGLTSDVTDLMRPAVSAS